MFELLKKVKESELPGNVKYYWGYMYELGNEYLVPYISKLGAFTKGDKVCEIGSAEGGVLASFVEFGASEGLGTDIAKDRLEFGNKISEICGMNLEFVYHNILSEGINKEWENKYDLVLLRDVIEHLENTEIALKNIKKIIKDGGHLFVTFPPYYSPFGGHQHTLANFWGKIPYIHCLPNFIFHRLIQSGRKADIEEVIRLQKIKLTTNKFERAANSAGYEVVNIDYYLIRPVFKSKFGLRPIKITFLKNIPFAKNLLALEATYLLKKVRG